MIPPGAGDSTEGSVRSALLVIVALVAFFYPISDQLTHFDEGQYAFARVWPWIPGFDADQALFSPPLFPFLVGTVQAIVGPVWWAGPAVSRLALFSGVLIAVALSRRVAPETSVRDAALFFFVAIALDPTLALYGAAGLTDALYSALLLAALFLADRAFERPTASRILAAGFAAGLSWWAKYSGPMTLVALLAFCRTRRQFLAWIAMAAVAAVVIAPWYAAVERWLPGGVAALFRHQRGYFQGVAAVPANLVEAARLMSNSVHAPHWVGVLLFFGPFCGALPFALRGPTAAARAWWRVVAVLALMPALYTPYLRLWLPSRLPLALLAVAGAQSSFSIRPTGGFWTWPRLFTTLSLVSFLTGMWFNVRGPHRFDEEAAERDYRRLLPRIVAEQAPGNAREAWLALEPPALFVWSHMPNALPARRIADAAKLGVDDLPRGVMLIVDWRAPATLPFDDSARFVRKEFPVELSIIAKLDEFRTVSPATPPTLRAYWRKP